MADARLSIQAEDLAGATIDAVVRDLDQLVMAGERMVSIAQVVAGVTAGFLALQKAVSYAASTVHEFNEWERATFGLSEAQIEATRTLELLTDATDTQIAKAMQIAGAMGIAEESTDDAVTAALGLAEALGQNLNTVLPKVADFMNGNSKALDILLPQLRNMEDSEAKVAAVLDVVNRGLEKSRNAAEGLEGAQERWNMRSRETRRLLGEAMAPILEWFYNSLHKTAVLIETHLIQALNDLGQSFLNLAAEWTSLLTIGETWKILQAEIAKGIAGLNMAVSGLLVDLGFDSQIERVKFFKQVIEELDRMQVGFADNLNRKIEENQGKWQELFKSIKEFGLTDLPALPDIDLKIGDGTATGTSKQPGDFSATESRILTRGPASDAAEKTAENTKEMALSIGSVEEHIVGGALSDEIAQKQAAWMRAYGSQMVFKVVK